MSSSAYQRINKAIERNNLYDFENALDMVSDDIFYVDKYFTKQNGQSLIVSILTSKSAGSDARVQIIQYLLNRGLGMTDDHLQEILNVRQNYGYSIDPEKNEMLLSVALEHGLDASNYISHCLKKNYHNSLCTIMKYNKIPIEMNKAISSNCNLTLFQSFIIDCITHEGYHLVKIENASKIKNTQIFYEQIDPSAKLKYKKNDTLRANLLEFIQNGADINMRITDGWSVLDMSSSEYMKLRNTYKQKDLRYVSKIDDNIDKTKMNSPNLIVPGEYLLSFLFRVVIPQFEPIYFKKDSTGNLQQLQIKSSNFEHDNDEDYDGVSDDDDGYIKTTSETKKKVVRRKNKSERYSNVVSSVDEKKEETEIEYDLMEKYYQTPLIIQDFMDNGANIDDDVVVSAVYGGHLEAVATKYFKLIKKNVNECIVAVGAFGSVSNLQKLMKLKGHDIKYRSQIKQFNPTQQQSRLYPDYYKKCGGYNVLDMAMLHHNYPMIKYLLENHSTLFEDKVNVGGPFKHLCHTIIKSNEQYGDNYPYDCDNGITRNNHLLFAKLIQMGLKKNSRKNYLFKSLHFDCETIKMVMTLLWGKYHTFYLCPDTTYNYFKSCSEFFSKYVNTMESISVNDSKYPMTDLVKGLKPLPLTITSDYMIDDGTRYGGECGHNNVKILEEVDYKISNNNYMTQIKELYAAGMSLSYPVSEGSLIDLLFNKLINSGYITDAKSIINMYETKPTYLNKSAKKKGGYSYVKVTTSQYFSNKTMFRFLISLCPDIFKNMSQSTVETMKSYAEICQEYITSLERDFKNYENKNKLKVDSIPVDYINFIEDMNFIINGYNEYHEQHDDESKIQNSTDVKTNTKIEFNINNQIDEDSKTAKAISNVKKNGKKSGSNSNTKPIKSKKGTKKCSPNEVIIEQ